MAVVDVVVTTQEAMEMVMATEVILRVQEATNDQINRKIHQENINL